MIASPSPAASTAQYHAWAGAVADEAMLRGVVSVLEDVMGDIAGWEDTALLEAVTECRRDLSAYVEVVAASSPAPAASDARHSEARRAVGKWLNECPQNEPDLRDIATLCADYDRLAAPAPAASITQCDGCQRGLPVNDWGHHRDESGAMGCTADRYAAPTPVLPAVDAVELAAECKRLANLYADEFKADRPTRWKTCGAVYTAIDRLAALSRAGQADKGGDTK
jgi:hypothetical protein